MTSAATLPIATVAGAGVSAVRGRGSSSSDKGGADFDLASFDDLIADASAGDDAAAEPLPAASETDAAPTLVDAAAAPITQGNDLNQLLALVAGGLLTVAQQTAPASASPQPVQSSATAAPAAAGMTTARAQAQLSALGTVAQLDGQGLQPEASSDGTAGSAASASARATGPDDIGVVIPMARAQNMIGRDDAAAQVAARADDSFGAAQAAPAPRSPAQLANAAATASASTNTGAASALANGSAEVSQASDPVDNGSVLDVPVAKGGGRASGAVRAKDASAADVVAAGPAPVSPPRGNGQAKGQDAGDNAGQSAVAAARREPVKIEVVKQETHFAPVMEHALAQQIADQTAPVLTGAVEVAPVADARPSGQASAVALPTTVKASDVAVKVMHIQLQPVELGTITVRMSMKDDGVELHVEAVREQTAQMIRDDRDALSRMLGAHGIKVDGLLVTVGESDRAQSGGFGAQSQPGGQNFQSQGQSQSGAASGGRGQGGQPQGSDQSQSNNRQQGGGFNGNRPRSATTDIFV